MYSNKSIEELLKTPLRICVLNIDYTNSNSPFKGIDPPYDPSQYLPTNLPWEWEMAFVDKARSHAQIQKLRNRKFDLYFNLCEGCYDEDFAGEDVIRALEYFNLPYTGGNGKFHSVTKQNMKNISSFSGVQTPCYCFVFDNFEIDLAIKHIKTYPMIVKHYNGYGSIGMTKKSKVNNDDELREQAQIMIKEYGGALIEEFIEGREFTVLVFEDLDNPQEPIVLNPVEFRFPAGDTFKTFALKYLDFQGMETHSISDVELDKKLREMTKKVFVNMSATGYGRSDIRVDKNGEPYFLELNPMPTMFCPPDAMGSADFIMKHDKTTTPEKMIYHIMQTAFKAHARKQVPYHIFFSSLYGRPGLFAKKDIRQGDLVMSDEAKPKYVVSKTHANSVFGGGREEWFINCATPIGEDVYTVWSHDLEEWKRFNHSCEPNVWYSGHGQTVVARRDIKRGEELTIDYCTLLADMEAEFECKCGEPGCRKRYTKRDYLREDLMKKYEGHYSSYAWSRVKKCE